MPSLTRYLKILSALIHVAHHFPFPWMIRVNRMRTGIQKAQYVLSPAMQRPPRALGITGAPVRPCQRQ